jgi:hypothetical protein
MYSVSSDENTNNIPGVYTATEDIIGYKRVALLVRKKCCYAPNFLCRIKDFFSFEPSMFKYITCIMKVKIPAGSVIVRNYNTPAKLRTDTLIPIEIYPSLKTNGQIIITICSMHDMTYAYKINKMHKPFRPLDRDLYKVCTSGLHFFTDKEKAESYPD